MNFLHLNLLLSLKLQKNKHEAHGPYGSPESKQPQKRKQIDCFVCSTLLRIFHLYGNVTITSEGLQILTYYKAWHSWPMSNEGCLACQIYCDTGQLYMMAKYEEWHLHLLLGISQWSCHFLFLRLWAGKLNTQHSACGENAHPTAPLLWLKQIKISVFLHMYKLYLIIFILTKYGLWVGISILFQIVSWNWLGWPLTEALVE